ncbi:hypothetical protein BC941DRAFT_419325 [Chlamydoabsidia padenii]|nr:hypothetical protein BC941DRAFT_419325 [Chlamydoabsidia padenii]
MSSPPDNNSSTSLRRYDLTLTTTSVSLSVNITYILSWVNDALDFYIKHDKLSSIRNLTTDWEDGRAFLCLAHRFYPSSISDSIFGKLMEQDGGNDTTWGNATTEITTTRSSLAFSVFERELVIAPPSLTDAQQPSSSYPLYITKVRQSLLPLNKGGIHIDNKDGDTWTQRTQTVLDAIQHTREQLQSLGLHSTSRNDGSPSTNDNDESNTNNVDQQSIGTGGDDTDNQYTRATSGWEDNLKTMEQLLMDLHCTMDEYNSWTGDIGATSDDNTTPTQVEKDRRLALIKSVEDAHNSFQDYLEHDQHVLAVFRKRALFTRATAPIRQDLDWVQAELLKTTTTDTGIKELEARVLHAGTLLHQLIQQHNQDLQNSGNLDPSGNMELIENIPTSHMATNQPLNDDDEQQQRALYGMEIDALNKKYQLVQSWVDNIRVWFVEAQRIRQWIGERIDILETSTIPDGVLSQDLSITADQVEDLNTRHEILEKEVELFDKEDMSRLRTHVKDLTVATTKEKDLSPADTTTIEITFTTLMTLDRLIHLLNRRSYHLQVLTLRVFWENEFLKTINWVNTKAQELDLFIKAQARWQDYTNHTMDTTASSLKSMVIDKLLEFERDISTFDQGQFTTTVNLYQEMDDTSEIELPNCLESRQVGVEETFEVLVHRTTFARQVVEQHLIMTDFMDAGDRLLYHFGEGLYEKLAQHTGKVYTLFLDQQCTFNGNDGSKTIDLAILDDQPLVDENADFQAQAVHLITETASLIPYTETSYALDQQENEAGNDRVESAVKARSSELVLFGESLEHMLGQYCLALQWHSKITDVYTYLHYIQDRIGDDIELTTDLVEKVEHSFGDQVMVLSEELVNNKDMIVNWDRQLQQHVDKITAYQTGLGMVDNCIQDLSDFDPSSTDDNIQTAILGAIKYLEDDGKLAASRVQALASILDQWKTNLSTAKSRQVWEKHFLIVSQWVVVHDQKCQHTQHESTWSPTKDPDAQLHHTGHLRQVILSLEQEWREFKKQSITLLEEAFETLTGGLPTLMKTSWVTQRQRQDDLMSQVVKLDCTLELTKALLTQQLEISRFLVDAQHIRSDGTNLLRWLNLSVLQYDHEGSALSNHQDQHTVDTYKKRVDDLWVQWQSFDHDSCFASARGYQLDLLGDLDQQCITVQKAASNQHDALVNLGQSIEQWSSLAIQTNDIRSDMSLWTDKVHSLDTRVADCMDELMADKEALLSKLALGSATCGNSFLDRMDDRVKKVDSMVQQWQEDEFVTLYADGLDLKDRRARLLERLVDLSGDGKKPLDIATGIENTETRLNQAQDRYINMVKPMLSLVSDMMLTSDQLDAWESVWTDMSVVSKKLSGRFDGVLMDKKRWLQQVPDSYSLTTLQELSHTAMMISQEIQTTSHSLLDSENAAFETMEQGYYALSTHEVPSLVFPTEIQTRHDQSHQLVLTMGSMAKQLVNEISWLQMGVNWLYRVDKQHELYETIMEDVEHFSGQWRFSVLFAEQNNWNGDHGKDGYPVCHDTTLTDLQHRVDGFIMDVGVYWDELCDWQSTQPCESRHEIGDELDVFTLWKQKAAQLENNCSNVREYLKYVSDLVDHQKALWQWSQNTSRVESQGEQLKADLLLENGNNDTLAGEPLLLLTEFDDKLTQVLNHAQNMTYPECPIRHTLANNDEDDRALINKYIHSRHEHLKDLSISSHRILNENERSARLKALVDGHVVKAETFLRWIQATDEQLQQVMTDGTDRLDLLETKLVKVHELEKGATLYANTHNNGLMESANHCMAAIQLDMDNNKQIIKDSNNNAMQLDRVTTIQDQVEHDWRQLSQALQQHGDHLKKDIHQAKCVDWSTRVVQKCQTINNQLSKSRLETLQEDDLDRWRHAISDIKSKDLAHLKELVHSDTSDRLIEALGDATEAYRQLEELVQTVCHDVEHQRRKSRYNQLVTTLLSSTSDTKNQLKELLLTRGTLPVESDALADEAHYNAYKKQRDSILGDWAPYEEMYKQEGEQFLLLYSGDGNTESGIDQQHQELLTGLVDLKQQIAQVDAHYNTMIQKRPILDSLHCVSSLLDDIVTKLDNILEDDYDDGLETNLTRVKKMVTESLATLGLKEQPGSTGAGMDDIYQKRHGVLLDRVDSISQQLAIHQQKHQLQQTCHRYQLMADRIKASAEKEIMSLESTRPCNDTLPDTSFGPQQYQQWAKKVASSEQVLHDLGQDVKSMVTKATSVDGLHQDDANKMQMSCQTFLGDLEQQIQHQQFLMDLVRRVLGHSKSADDITSWLARFLNAVDGISATVSVTLDGDMHQKLQEEINGLELKHKSFEPIMGSLENLNTTIQGTTRLDDIEAEFAAHWKQLAQQKFDTVDQLWKESVATLEMVKKSVNHSLQATVVTRKIESLMTTMGNMKDQVEQLKSKSVFMGDLPVDDNQKNQQKQHDLFKSMPRKHTILAAEETLAVIKRGLVEQKQNQWAEINGLVKQYNDDRQNPDDNGGDRYPFLEAQTQMETTWNNIMETIDDTKLSLRGEKDIGNYLSTVDDIDILLDSMDDVILKTAPDYQATMISNRYSKAELQAKLIELNARFNYYKLNIQQKMQHSDNHWATINKGRNHRLTILEHHRLSQQNRWKKMMEQQVPSRQIDLKKGLDQSNPERKPRVRKTSLPTRKAAGTVTPPPSRMSPTNMRSPKATPKISSSSSTAEPQPHGRQRLRTVSSSSALVASKRPPIVQRESSSTSTASKTTQSTSPTLSINKKTSVSSLRKKPNAYVAQAGNVLDVEIGRIVNETPYRIKVKMVPGEVGRYWFGDVNPKLVYCRVLKSKMVMVRVGGGWTELSQFLRDHALLEGELIIPKQQSQQLVNTPIQEGYLEATTSLQRQRQQRIQQHLEQLQQNSSLTIPSPIFSSSSLPTMLKSRSTPPNRYGLLQQRGYKDGDRFFAVDRHGNQLEVKMTKFSQKGGILPTSTTNRRRKVMH